MTEGNEMVYPDPLRGSAESMFNQEPHRLQSGLTKREHFAAMAMQGIISSGIYAGEGNHTFLSSLTEMNSTCQDAVAWADALIKALNQTP
jgi:hypothetical protein